MLPFRIFIEQELVAKRDQQVGNHESDEFQPNITINTSIPPVNNKTIIHLTVVFYFNCCNDTGTCFSHVYQSEPILVRRHNRQQDY